MKNRPLRRLPLDFCQSSCRHDILICISDGILVEIARVGVEVLGSHLHSSPIDALKM